VHRPAKTLKLPAADLANSGRGWPTRGLCDLDLLDTPEHDSITDDAVPCTICVEREMGHGHDTFSSEVTDKVIESHVTAANFARLMEE
jgi:hypothetical protein